MTTNDKPTCDLCGEPMPEGEEMFKIHGYSGPCPKPPLERPTLEKLLRMTVPVGPGCIAPEGSPMSPEFRVAIQNISEDGVHFIIHAHGHDSETMDFIVTGNSLTPGRPVLPHRSGGGQWVGDGPEQKS